MSAPERPDADDEIEASAAETTRPSDQPGEITATPSGDADGNRADADGAERVAAEGIDAAGASPAPLTDTADAVEGTDAAVLETDEAVIETDSAVVETGEAVLETSGPSEPAIDSPDGGEPDADAPAGAADAGQGDAVTGEQGSRDATAALEEDADEKPRMDLTQLKAIVEALIFASPEPITPKMLLKLLNDEPKEDVLAAVDAVKQDYDARPGLHVAEVAGGYQITTRPELHEWVRRLFHERTTQKLSVASLETLSVIAYKQPITQAEIGEIRGVNTSGVLSTLLERHLIKIVGRKNVIGRPFLYGTTREFLIRFGLKDVYDLPKIEDMAQQLGFEPPAVLMEQNVPEDMLPLDEEPAPGRETAEGDEPPPEAAVRQGEPSGGDEAGLGADVRKDEEPSHEG
jgi:segregation and condensation protein B